MSIPGKIVFALLSALLVSAVTPLLQPTFSFSALLLPCAVAALLAVIASHKPLPMPAALAESSAPASPARRESKKPKREKAKPSKPRSDKDKKAAARPAAGPRESGTVKWFNGSKGFGFIVRENGEEIFVHHRSIVGDGRRTLKDGSPVSYRVVTTDKGPQAEDVEATG